MRVRDRWRGQDLELHEAVEQTCLVNFIGVMSRFIATRITVEELNEIAHGELNEGRFVVIPEPVELPTVKPRKRRDNSKTPKSCPHCDGKKKVQK